MFVIVGVRDEYNSNLLLVVL